MKLNSFSDLIILTTQFLTTCENLVANRDLVQQRKAQWKSWLTTHAEIPPEN